MCCRSTSCQFSEAEPSLLYEHWSSKTLIIHWLKIYHIVVTIALFALLANDHYHDYVTAFLFINAIRFDHCTIDLHDATKQWLIHILYLHFSRFVLQDIQGIVIPPFSQCSFGNKIMLCRTGNQWCKRLIWMFNIVRIALDSHSFLVRGAQDYGIIV